LHVSPPRPSGEESSVQGDGAREQDRAEECRVFVGDSLVRGDSGANEAHDQCRLSCAEVPRGTEIAWGTGRAVSRLSCSFAVVPHSANSRSA
jgi:hypothetical protein